MFVRQNKPPAVKTAAIVYKAVVCRGKHIHVNFSQFKLLQHNASFVGFVKINAFASRYFLPPGTFHFLHLFIAEMVCRTNFGVIVHFFCPQLNFDKTAGVIIVKGYVQRTVPARTYVYDVIFIIWRCFRAKQRRMIFSFLTDYFCTEASCFKKIRQRVCNFVKIF